METPRTDLRKILSDLNNDREFYKAKLDETEKAITALQNVLGVSVVTGTTTSTTTTTTTTIDPNNSVSWADEIRKIFDTGVELSMKELLIKLNANGIYEAETKRGKNSVYSTVSRLSKDPYNELEKLENGKYRKRVASLNPINFIDGETSDGDPEQQSPPD